MNIIDQVETKAKAWLFGVAIKKAVVSFCKAAFAYCIAHGIKVSVSIPGIGVLDTNSELALTAFINSGLTVLRNYLKQKFPEGIGKYL